MNQRISRRRSSRAPWKWFAAAAAGGVPVGLLWWLLAPGGMNLITRDPGFPHGGDPEVLLPRDLTLAGLFVFAGCLLAVLLVDKDGSAGQQAFLLSLAGALAGAFVAWQAGLLAAQLWGAPADAPANPGAAFSLRSHSVLLLWPAATAAAVFVLSLLHLLRNGPGTPVSGDAAAGA